MDFAYSDEQAAAIELARQILTDACTPQRLRALELADQPRFDRALWSKLAEAGLIAAAVPEEQGGADLGFLTRRRDHRAGRAHGGAGAAARDDGARRASARALRQRSPEGGLAPARGDAARSC